MPPYAAFHLGLHCLSKYSFKGFLVLKGLNENYMVLQLGDGSHVLS